MNEQDPTPHNRLRELLDQARARLGSDFTGADHQQRLQTAIGQAEAVLAARFDVNHPQLAASLRELADLLGKAGI